MSNFQYAAVYEENLLVLYSSENFKLQRFFVNFNDAKQACTILIDTKINILNSWLISFDRIV